MLHRYSLGDLVSCDGFVCFMLQDICPITGIIYSSADVELLLLQFQF